MNILIPMAGAGSRFVEAGYSQHKPAIMTTDRITGQQKPMVVCAAQDLPGVEADGSNIIYIDRDFHQADGLEQAIRKYYPSCRFVTVDHLTEGQASTCLLAESYIANEQELLIAGCDNGMVLDMDKFNQERQKADMLVFTYRHNEAVVEKPDAYGWCIVDEDNNIRDVSIKKPISDNPKNDHAIVATFWFRKGTYFVEAARKMIAADDRINGEFYVDEVVRHLLAMGLRARVFEIDRYIGWGTPKDYELYEATMRYWQGFIACDKFLGL